MHNRTFILFNCTVTYLVVWHVSVPGELRNVQMVTINSTAIFIKWRLPAETDRNGVIRGFAIRCVLLNSSAANPVMRSSVDPVIHEVLDPTATEATVADLQANTDYEVQVAAFSRKGLGELSRPRVIRTKGLG